MAQPARCSTISRRSWLIAGLGASLFKAFGANSMAVRLDGETLFIAAPQLHFLTGKPLERLKDGAPVSFLTQLSISLDQYSSLWKRANERFVVSYDLWEEKFSVVRLSETTRKVTRLSAQETENWCINRLTINTSGLEADRPFWLQLEMRAADAKDQTAVLGEPGINLTRLIEVFSRPARDQQPRWILDAGPLRLSDLKKSSRRGPHGG